MPKRRRAASGDPVSAQVAGRLRRGLGVGAGQSQETAGLTGDVVEVDKATALADDIEEIAVLARSGISLMCS